VWDKELFYDIKHIINYLRVDERYCACEIVFQDLLPNDEVARTIALIGRDRDFWINEDPRSEILSTVIDSNNWKAIISDKLSKGIAIDNEVTEEYELAVERKNEALSRSLNTSKLFDGVAVARGSGFSSDLAAALRNKYNTKIEVIINDNGAFSIRSVEPVSNKIATSFGGGGHPTAAGGTLHFNIIDKLVFKLSPFRQHKAQNLIKTALRFV
jgi:oligoribonuclease NrnB/cAMP/cGMP phosphodiesterase (DHH superfamily)